MLAESIEHHKKKHAEEVVRAAGRNAWVQALRESLK
jgi:Arc/MetJ family transcription regulator